MTDLGRHCSPAYLLGSLATDGAPVRLSMKVSEGYAAALADLPEGELQTWIEATAGECLYRGWHEAVIALLALPSKHSAPTYERRAQKYLNRVQQKED